MATSFLWSFFVLSMAGTWREKFNISFLFHLPSMIDYY